MHDLLVALEVLGALLVAAVVAPLAYARWRVRRQLRVSPSVPSPAPSGWLVSTSPAARLHRRVRRANSTARTAAALDPALVELARELDLEAVALERQLVAVARLGRRGSEGRRAIDRRVSEVEVVASRLASMAGRRQTSSLVPDDRFAELHLRLDALEAARVEVDQLVLRTGVTPRQR